jgi:hypothetical protein
MQRSQFHVRRRATSGIACYRDHVSVGFLDEIFVNMAIGGISTRGEYVVRSYRESMAAAVLHSAP